MKITDPARLLYSALLGSPLVHEFQIYTLTYSSPYPMQSVVYAASRVNG